MFAPELRSRRAVTRIWLSLSLFAAVLVLGSVARAQVAELELAGMYFTEPSAKSSMTVYNPSASLSVMPWEFLTVTAGWEADIVSGASEPVKGGPLSPPDVISQASVVDTRHIASGTIGIQRKTTQLSATYAYATENDYRSHSIAASAATEFLQRNTRLELSYAKGFDQVCNVRYPPTIDPTVRQRLDSSKGCFTSAANRQEDDIALDTFGAGWTQAWTPHLTTQITLNLGLQHGFLGNPYRGVVIGAGGQVAQENHPDNRVRQAGSLRAKYYIKPIATTVGIGVRGYRDSWDILSATYELEIERYVLPWLRAQVRGRYYTQTGALFWSDDYTGGEPEHGPRGQYWSGDREISPLHSYAGGARAVASWKASRDARIAGMLLETGAGLNFDVIKTELDDFSWAGERPDDTTAFIVGLSLHGGF